MEDRLGSGIDAPEWMQQFARELERVQDEKYGLIAESLHAGRVQRITQKELDRQIAGLMETEDDPAGSF